jgi:hypothetical protein
MPKSTLFLFFLLFFIILLQFQNDLLARLSYHVKKQSFQEFSVKEKEEKNNDSVKLNKNKN